MTEALLPVGAGLAVAVAVYIFARRASRSSRVPVAVIEDDLFGRVRSYADGHWETDTKSTANGAMFDVMGSGTTRPTSTQREAYRFVVSHFSAILSAAVSEASTVATSGRRSAQESDFSVSSVVLHDEGPLQYEAVVVAPRLDRGIAFEVAVGFDQLEVIEVEEIH